MKYMTSVAFGVLSFGWLNLVYLYFYEHLHLSFEIGPKVLYCKKLIGNDVCNLVAYGSLWLTELPVAVLGFATFSALLYLVKKFSAKVSFIAQMTVVSYMVSFLFYIMLGPFSNGSLVLVLGTCLFHGAIFSVCLWFPGHLAHYFSRSQRAGEAE